MPYKVFLHSDSLGKEEEDDPLSQERVLTEMASVEWQAAKGLRV